MSASNFLIAVRLNCHTPAVAEERDKVIGCVCLCMSVCARHVSAYSYLSVRALKIKTA